jgi:signal transduction histidine kinase
MRSRSKRSGVSATAATEAHRPARRGAFVTIGTRITVAFVVILAVALTLAAAVSFALVRNADTLSARNLVLAQTENLARSTEALSHRGQSETKIFEDLLPLVASVAGIKEAAIVEASPPAHLVSDQPLDIGLHTLDARTLARSAATAGVSRGIAYAAVPLFTLPASGTQKKVVVALYLARLVGATSASISYFLLAGGISLVTAAIAAAIITRRVSRRVVDAAVAARRIAAGDLSTRLELSRSDVGELGTLRDSLNQMAARLEDLRDLDRQFLLAVSHDLRTPLTSILGYAEAIMEGEVEDPTRAARVVVGEANRLDRLIGDLLDLARLDAHQFALNLDDLDAATVVSNAAASLRYAAEAASVTLVVDTDDPVAMVGDHDRIAQIVSNLIENAMRFAQTQVEVHCEATPDGYVVITVTDDGPRIAEEDRPRIFERHYSSVRRPGRSAGTGLGLTIVSELVAQMGGTVEVTSPVVDGHGTRFSVRLPAHPAAIKRPPTPSLAVQRER